MQKLAGFMAVTDLFGSKPHALEYRNMRLYYNPATSRLEPIGFDQRFLQPVRYLTGSGKAPVLIGTWQRMGISVFC